MPTDPNVSYFRDYTPIQAHKHALINSYLGAWYPKLASWSGRVLYLETHAGRGVHDTGQFGSPLVAIHALLNHPQRQRIMDKCEFHFYLMEDDPKNATILMETVAQEPKHSNLKIHIERCDFARKFKEELDQTEARGAGLAPSLVFIDPYGYDIPIELVKRVLTYPSCEVVVNFMAQPVARAVGDRTKGPNLDLLYGSDVWRRAEGLEFNARKEVVTALYEEAVGAKWTTKLRLTSQTDYTLMHFTNHPEGRATMKKSVWAITGKYGKPGVNQLLIKDNPNQGTLITLEPDLKPLNSALQSAFYRKTFSRSQALDWLLSQDYLETHLHRVLADGRRDGWLETDHKGPFGPSMRDTLMTVVGGSLF